jgi:hypothetical protein
MPSKNASIPTPSPIQNMVDPQQFAILSKLEGLLGTDYNSDIEEQLFLELSRKLKRDRCVRVTESNGREQCWIHVPVNESESSFKKYAKDWLGQALKELQKCKKQHHVIL